MQNLWDLHQKEQEWGFLLIDVKNAFNEQKRTSSMLRTVQHEWPSGARFLFHCYNQTLGNTHARRQQWDRRLHFQQKGCHPGRPSLHICAYGIGILPLIRLIKAKFPAVEEPSYANDTGAGRKFSEIHCLGVFCKLVQEIGPSFGYCPEPSKSSLVVPQHNLESAQAAFPDFGFKATMGSHYLGGFIGEDDALHAWLHEKTKTWEEAVGDLASVAPNFPQAAYSDLQKSLEQE
jgi:hypothetical protein